jgi:hypothetical protein
MSTTPNALYPSDPNAPQPIQPKQGFRGILKNSILPAVSQFGNAMGTLYGSPAVRQGEQALHEQGMQQQELNRQRAYDVPGLQEAYGRAAEVPYHVQQAASAAEIARKQANIAPEDFDAAIAQDRAKKNVDAAYSPIAVPTTGPNGEPGAKLATLNVPPAGGPTQISDVQQGTTPPPQIPTTPGWSVTGAPPPEPIANAASAPTTVSAPLKFSPGPWIPGQGQSGYDQFNRPMGVRPGMPAGAMSKTLPPVQMMPYFKAAGIDPMTATSEQTAAVLNEYNKHETVQMVQQLDGSIVPETMTTSQHGVLSPNSSGSSTPAKPRSSGAPAGGKVPPGVAKAYGDYNGALTRQDVMNKSLPEALAGNQQAMINILANHLGMTAGIQKGARINQAMWNEAASSTPWIQGLLARYGHTDQQSGDFVFDGPLSGVTIPPEALKQMVSLADDRVNAQYSQWQREIKAARSGYGMAPSSPNSSTPSGAPAGGGASSGAKNDPLGIR